MIASASPGAFLCAGERGFTMIELLAAITIVGLLMAVSVPASMRFYDSIKYRQSVRDVITLLGSARYQAVNTGKAQDVMIDPQALNLHLNKDTRTLPDGFSLVVRAAKEINRDDKAVIRFYPEGGSSGGDIDIERPDGGGVTISVDWLIGRVSQKPYALD